MIILRFRLESEKTMQKITKLDVFKYMADELPRERRLKIEEASKSDSEVRRWIDELTPTVEELNQQPVPEVQLDPASPEGKRLGIDTFMRMQDEDS